MCLGILPACVYVCHLHVWYMQRQEKGPAPLELELLMVVKWQVGAGNLTWVFGHEFLF